MQGIYTYIPETNYVLREYSVAAILLLLFMVLISLVSVLNLLFIIIIIIIIIITYLLTYLLTYFTSKQFSWLSKEYGQWTKHCPVENFLTIRHVLSISAFCIRLYRPGHR